jgi:MoaA/NifB/PqqE/SkfB family radical SAM enzyme
MTLSRKNSGDFPAAIKAIRGKIPSITPNDLHINLMTLSENYYDNLDCSDGVGVEDIQEIAAINKSRHMKISPYQFIETKYLRMAQDYLSTGKSPVPCQALSATCFIDPAGTVYPCSSWNRPLGNLREYHYDLADIWNSDSTMETRKMVVKGGCPGCWTPCEAFPSLGGSLHRLF